MGEQSYAHFAGLKTEAHRKVKKLFEVSHTAMWNQK